MRAARSKCLTGVNFLFAPRGEIGRPSKKSFLCSRRGTYTRTFPDPRWEYHSTTPSWIQATVKFSHQGTKTALRRLHVNLGHPTNDDLTRCLAAGGGTRVALRAVKCMRCFTCERMSGPRSHRPSRIPTNGERCNERLFVDLCDVVDVRGSTYW